MRFRAAKVDENQRTIVRALEAFGASVQLLHAVGGGCPDLLVGYRGNNWLLEVKNPATRYGQGKKGGATAEATKRSQLRWHLTWRGRVCTVRTVDEALQTIGAREVARESRTQEGRYPRNV